MKNSIVPHGGPENRSIAERGLILKVLVGSGVHGTALDETDDTDYMGICIEPPEQVIGIQPPWAATFEQYQQRTAAERTGLKDAPSGPGDVDEVVYSLRKWLRLALEGNPTVLLPLFTPDTQIAYIDDYGRELRQFVSRIAPSRSAGERFLGYMRSQREKMLGLRSTQTKRPKLISKHGFDTKFAMHMIRLGLQGVEYLETGKITLPVPEPHRSWLVEMRRGRYGLEDTIAHAEKLESRLEALLQESPLPQLPDWDDANRWLVRIYQRYWSDKTML